MWQLGHRFDGGVTIRRACTYAEPQRKARVAGRLVDLLRWLSAVGRMVSIAGGEAVRTKPLTETAHSW